MARVLPKTPALVIDDKALMPLAVSIPEACRISGVGRTKLYQAIADGHVHAVKAGTRTLIILGSLTAYINALPRFRCAGQCGAAP